MFKKLYMVCKMKSKKKRLDQPIGEDESIHQVKRMVDHLSRMHRNPYTLT